MRVTVIYVHSHAARRNALGVQGLHCSPRLGIHDAARGGSACRRPKREGQECREVGDALQDPHLSEEPPAKIQRTEDSCEKTQDSPNNRLDTTTVGTTRRLLQGVLAFFRVREATTPLQKTSSLSGVSLTHSFRRFFVASHPPEDQQQQQPQQEDLQQQHILQQQQQQTLQYQQVQHQQLHLQQQQQQTLQHQEQLQNQQQQQHLHNQQQQAKLQQEQLQQQQQHLHHKQQMKVQHQHQEPQDQQQEPHHQQQEPQQQHQQRQHQQQEPHQQQQQPHQQQQETQYQQQEPQQQHQEPQQQQQKKQRQQKKRKQQPHSATVAEPQGKVLTEEGPKKAAKKKKTPAVIRRSRPNDGDEQVFASNGQIQWFIQLTEMPEVESFLKRDICCRYADKYLLAMVFTYFVRADLKKEEYTKENFFAALYLAHDIEEDEEELKYELFPWALGKRWRKNYNSLLKVRDDLFFAIHCRAIVSKRGCHQVMEFNPDCWLWRRERPAYHGGAIRDYMKHSSDNGRPRGPDKSPIRCYSCLVREQEKSGSSYLIYLSDSNTSGDSLNLRSGVTTEHKETEASSKHKDGDSGFETFLLEPNGDANSLGAL